MNTDALRTMREEMESIVSLCERGTLAQIKRWGIIIDAYLATPRCPHCGTSVKPDLLLHANIHGDDAYTVECVACQHEGPKVDNEQDALKAFCEGKP